MTLRFKAEAEADLAEAMGGYEAQRNGLGAEFLASVEALMQRIEANPLHFPIVTRHCRRALLGRFPFAVYFLSGELGATVYAVLHQRRAPAAWQRRISDGN